MTRKEFNQYIQEASFQELVVTEMGWNNPKGMTDIIVPHIDEIDYEMEVIAERNGFQILTCLVEKIPTASTCKKIDIKLRQQMHNLNLNKFNGFIGYPPKNETMDTEAMGD